VAADPEVDPQVAALLRQGWSAEAQPLDRRRLLTEGLVGGAFLVAAVALAALGDAERSFDPVKALVLTLAFALAIRVHVDVGAGYTTPVQVVFVPMLLLAPTPLVPLLVALGWALGRLPDLRGGRVHPDRLLLVLANSWFAIGPALVLTLADAQTPDWGDWPVYLAALAAQFAGDLGAGLLREWLGQGIAPELQLRAIGLVPLIDTLLAPLGLLAAFASADFDYAFVLLLPTLLLLVFYARERRRRLENALALADADRERGELIAAASHELVTPLGVLIGLTDRMAPGRRFDDERREQVHAAMTRELVQLRQLVRQFVDFTRLRTDRDLDLSIEPTPVRPVLDHVTTALAATGTVEVSGVDGLHVRADPNRLHQMVLSLTAEVLRGAPRARVAVHDAGEAVEIVVSGPARPDATGDAAGIGLEVTRELALAHGGLLVSEVRGRDEASYTLRLPRG
jgi:signal transduction histidine kinase